MFPARGVDDRAGRGEADRDRPSLGKDGAVYDQRRLASGRCGKARDDDRRAPTILGETASILHEGGGAPLPHGDDTADTIATRGISSS